MAQSDCSEAARLFDWQRRRSDRHHRSRDSEPASARSRAVIGCERIAPRWKFFQHAESKGVSTAKPDRLTTECAGGSRRLIFAQESRRNINIVIDQVD